LGVRDGFGRLTGHQVKAGLRTDHRDDRLVDRHRVRSPRAARALGHAAHLLRPPVQLESGSGQAVLGEQPNLLSPSGAAAVDGQAMASQIVERAAMRGGARLLPRGCRLLRGVPVRQVRCRQPLDLIRRRGLEHPEHAQHIGAQVVGRPRLVRLALARHQPRPPVRRDRPPAGRRPRPAAEGTRRALNPMIASTTDTPPPPISQGLVSERRREEGCDDAQKHPKAVVCWANAVRGGVGHGSGYGSGIASADGRRLRRIAQRTSPPGAGRAVTWSAARSGYGRRLCSVIIGGLSLESWPPPPAL
jgi:hypothetical protein